MADPKNQTREGGMTESGMTIAQQLADELSAIREPEVAVVFRETENCDVQDWSVVLELPWEEWAPRVGEIVSVDGIDWRLDSVWGNDASFSASVTMANYG